MKREKRSDMALGSLYSLVCEKSLNTHFFSFTLFITHIGVGKGTWELSGKTLRSREKIKYFISTSENRTNDSFTDARHELLDNKHTNIKHCDN